MDKLRSKEGIVAIFLAVIHFALWYYFAYIKYAGVAVKDYKYILGLPEWFFYSSVVVSIFIIIMVIIFTNFLFNKDIEKENNNEV